MDNLVNKYEYDQELVQLLHTTIAKLPSIFFQVSLHATRKSFGEKAIRRSTADAVFVSTAVSYGCFSSAQALAAERRRC